MSSVRLFFFVMVVLIFLSSCDMASQDSLASQSQSSKNEQSANSVIQCPVSCTDNDDCTDDHCSNDTGFKCTYDEIVPCCGNGICEENETYENCKSDCAECTAGKCQTAEFDHDTGRCVVEPLVPCCGNGICEENETYESCKSDCAECTAGKCEIVVVDNDTGQCSVEPLVPCCGNSICEKNETYESCSLDCPECTTDAKCKRAVFDYATQQCATKPLVPCCGNNVCDVGESCTNCEEDCECKENVDLVKYPGFLEDGTLIVVGDNASSQDVITATGMITKLAVDGVDAESDILSLISQSKLSSKDMIVLGDPCHNRLWQDYMSVDCDADYIKTGRAIIKLVIQNNRQILFIAGHTPLDTKKAAEALTDGKISFSSTEVELDTSGSSAQVI